MGVSPAGTRQCNRKHPGEQTAAGFTNQNEGEFYNNNQLSQGFSRTADIPGQGEAISNHFGISN